MVNPVDLIGKSRRRLARLAAARAALVMALPVIATVVIVAALDWIGEMTWEQFGYILSPDAEVKVGEVLLGVATIELLGLGLLAWHAYRQANDFQLAAEVIDHYVGGHQEIITLAAMADPAHPEGRERRSPLFPMLWRRVIAYLDLFDPRREFKLEVGQPLRRSSMAAAAVVALLGLATIAFVEIPTPEQLAAHRLRALARALDTASKTPSEKELVKAMRDLARDLDNPKLPPEQKMQELEAMKREMEKVEQRRQLGTSLTKGSSSGSGSGNGSGQGRGNGSGAGAGEGAGSGAGKGNGTGQGSGARSGAKGSKVDQQMVELGNDLSKAQAQIQAESGPPDKSKGTEQTNTGSGAAPKQGDNPNATGPRNQPNGTGLAMSSKPGGEVRSNLPLPASGTPSGRHDDKGSMGDTHLGDIPKAANYERFYKAGEGPPLEIHDARYVTFRLPSAAVNNAGGGRTVADSERPVASAAYTNTPLKQQRLNDTPDERQLVPPRYRDLIH